MGGSVNNSYNPYSLGVQSYGQPTTNNQKPNAAQPNVLNGTAKTDSFTSSFMKSDMGQWAQQAVYQPVAGVTNGTQAFVQQALQADATWKTQQATGTQPGSGNAAVVSQLMTQWSQMDPSSPEAQQLQAQIASLQDGGSSQSNAPITVQNLLNIKANLDPNSPEAKQIQARIDSLQQLQAQGVYPPG